MPSWGALALMATIVLGGTIVVVTVLWAVGFWDEP